MQAMVFAAGLGTRLKPLTNSSPKALVKYKGKTLLQWNLEKLKRYGFTHIVINVHHLAEQIKLYLRQNKNFGLNIYISDETDQLLDTGGGLYKAIALFRKDEPILLHNVDILSDLNLLNLMNFHINSNAAATLAVTKRPSNRILVFDNKGYLCSWKNKVTGEIKIARKNCIHTEEFAFSGIHIISYKALNYLWQGRYSIIDFYLKIAETNKINFFLHSHNNWRDMGTLESLNDLSLSL